MGLDDDSFFAAGLALENAFTDKVEHCKKLGISIEPDDWPCCGLFEGILADRGPLRGHSASNLVQSLGIRIATTSPFRADCKGIVERTFRSLNDLLIHRLPGAVRKPKERGEKDPRLEAGLTVKEFEILLVHAILYQNQRRIEGYRLQRDMIADGVPAGRAFHRDGAPACEVRSDRVAPFSNGEGKEDKARKVDGPVRRSGFGLLRGGQGGYESRRECHASSDIVFPSALPMLREGLKRTQACNNP